MLSIHTFLAQLLQQYLLPWGKACYRRPLFTGVVLSLLTSLYLIADYAVINRSVLPLLWQLQHGDETSLFGQLILGVSNLLGVELITAGHWLMVICHAAITALLLLIAKQLFFSKLSRWALIFLLLANPSYDDFRTYIMVEPLFWCCWLLAVYALLTLYKRHTVMAIAIWFTVFLLATELTLVAWFWLLIFPFGALFWRPWRRRSVAYALLGYAVIVGILLLLPVGENGITPLQWWINTLVNRPSSLSDILGLNQSSWVKEENSAMASVFVFSGAISLVVVRTLISLGIVCTGLAVYAVIRRQHKIVDEEHLRILFYLIGFDLFISVVVFVINKDSGSLVPFSICFLLILLAALGLSYVFKKMATARYSRLTVLVIVWCLVAYFASGMIIFGPRRGYVKEAGQYAKTLKELPLYADNALFLYYAGADSGKTTEWKAIQPQLGQQAFYFAYSKHRHKLLNNGLEHYQPLATFGNPRGDKLLIYRFSQKHNNQK